MPFVENGEIKSAEDMESYFDEVNSYLAEVFNVDYSELEAPEFADVEEASGRGMRTSWLHFDTGYNPDLNLMVFNDQRKYFIERNSQRGSSLGGSPKEDVGIPVSTLGNHVAQYLRTNAGPGDETIGDQSVLEFFGRLGELETAEKYGEEPLGPKIVKFGGARGKEEQEIHFTSGWIGGVNTRSVLAKGPDNPDRETFRENLILEAAQFPSDPPAVLWTGASAYGGCRAADEHKDKATGDENLIHKTSREVRDEFGLFDFEMRGLDYVFHPKYSPKKIRLKT